MGAPRVTRRLFVADSIHTSSRPRGDSLLVEHGHVVSIGFASDLRDADTQEVRFDGGVILPGFRDAHIHPFGYAASRHGALLDGAGSLADVRSVVAAAATVVDPRWAVIGMRLDEERLDEHTLPTRGDLDSVVPDRPVLLYRICGHVAVVNTAALTAAGIDRDTPDPSAGSFDRDEDGVPTGILRETAVARVAASLRPPPLTRPSLLDALGELAAHGITSLGAIVSSSADSGEVEMLADVADDLPLRVHTIVMSRSPAELEAAAHRLDHPLARFEGVKEFADGSFGGRTASLRDPYADAPLTTGTVRLDPSSALPRARIALDLGGSVAVHAIGDDAVSRTLDLFEVLLDEGAPASRLRIEHASLVADADLERMADLGVWACIQPAFVPSDAPWLPHRLGTFRAGRTYRFSTMSSLGIPLAGGSDAPVESPDPLAGMAAARVRSKEALSADQALALYTDDGARLLGEPEPLDPGSPADFIVMDAGPPDPALVRSTWVEGRRVWGSQS
jgi:predicted amidohydrolase YtcJ